MRRRGRFYVIYISDEVMGLILEGKCKIRKEIMQIMGEMIIVSCEHSALEKRYVYHAYSGHFDEAGDCAESPLCVIKITADAILVEVQKSNCPNCLKVETWQMYCPYCGKHVSEIVKNGKLQG